MRASDQNSVPSASYTTAKSSTFVAVHDGHADAPIVWQSLIAFQTSVDLMNRFPQRASIHLGVYGSHGFGAGHGMSQCFQNRDAPVISKALRLPIHAQNKTMDALTTVKVEMRGSSLRSVMAARTSSERRQTFSE